MDSLMDIEKWCNVFDTVLNSIGPVALQNDETRTGVLATFENILLRFNYAVPIIQQIVLMVRQLIRLVRFGQRLYQLIMSTLDGSGLNGSRSRPLQY